MRNVIKQAFLIILMLLDFTNNALALEKPTHELLNESIAKQFWFNNYLINNLGLKKGIEEKFKEKQVIELMADGGIKEDEPLYMRSLNHLHDPLQPWYIAGYDKTFKSSLIWAQSQGLLSPLVGGDWSWKKARTFSYQGLIGVNRNDREENLADTFQALGQIMHLVQDASVPAHVRNDAHLYIEFLGLKKGYHYEVWVGNNHERLHLNPSSFEKSIFNIIPEGGRGHILKVNFSKRRTDPVTPFSNKRRYFRDQANDGCAS